MVIPKEHLGKVDYYKVSFKHGMIFGRRTVVTLYYKSQWRRSPEKFVFKWYQPELGVWKEPEDAVLLKNNLISYFGQ